jgi:hypothetical protein
VKNLGETAFGLLGLVKMLILAGLYEELHGPPGLAYTSPQAFLLHSAGWVFDKILGKQMKDADTQVKAIFTEVGKIFKDPKRFFGAAWASASGDYVKKWHEFESLVKTGRAVDQFKAGVIAGDVLTTVVLTVLAIVSGVGAAIRTGEAVVGGVRALIGAAEVTEAAAANLAKEAPELVKAARGLEDVKPGASAAEDAEGATEKPIKDQSTAKKGVFGEAKADAWMDGKGYKKLNGDLVQIGDTPKGPGIDGVWEKPGPPPEYVVTDAKYGSAGLNTLADGTKQMSPSWINDRLPGEVGDETADEIKAAGYQRWVLQVDDQGVVTQRILPPGKP